MQYLGRDMTIVFLAHNALECLLDSHTIEINRATVVDAWVDLEGDGIDGT